MLILGSPIFIKEGQVNYSAKLENDGDLELLVSKLKEYGFKAAYCPYIDLNNTSLIRQTKEVFRKEDILLTELGYWENMLDTNLDIREQKRRGMLDALQLADELGAYCAITCVGTFAEGSHRQHRKESFSERAFDEIVTFAQYAIDTVKPKTAKFSYEIYQFNILDNIDDMKRVAQAINRDAYGVHMDHVNLLNSPRNFFRSLELCRDFVDKLGDKIVSCHVKDVWMNTDINDDVRFKEVMCGMGGVDLAGSMKILSEIDRVLPYMMEHLTTQQEYLEQAKYLRNLAEINNIQLK